MPPTYLLRPGRLSDIPSAANLYTLSFAHEPLLDYMFPTRHADPRPFALWTARKFQARYWTPGFRLTMLVEDQGRPVGFAWWKRPVESLTFRERWLSPYAWLAPLMSLFLKLRDTVFPISVPYPDRVEIYARTFATVEPTILTTPRRREAWYLASLGVDPELQGKSFGSMILRHGLEEADEAGVATWLVGLKGLDKYYSRFGFVEVGRASVGELKNWEGGVVMFRE